MNAIRIRKTIDSDTLHLPELGALIGHTVDILIEGQSATGAGRRGTLPGTGDSDTLLAEAQQLQDYDYTAQRDQDARDIRDAQGREKWSCIART